MDELTHYMEACSRLRERAEQAERALQEAEDRCNGENAAYQREYRRAEDAELALAEWKETAKRVIDSLNEQVLEAQAERDTARRALAEANERVEQYIVQMAGVSTAAMGWNDNAAKEGEYGWSVPYKDVLDLREKYDTARRDLATRNEDALMWQREYDRLFVELAGARRALAEKEAECERVRGTLVEWLRNMEAPVIRAFGQERWNAARQTIFDEGNASWTMILRVAAETIAADLSEAHAALAVARKRLQRYGERTDLDPAESAFPKREDCVTLDAKGIDSLTPPASGAQG